MIKPILTTVLFTLLTISSSLAFASDIDKITCAYHEGQDSYVDLWITDSTGKRVCTLLDNAFVIGGEKERLISWGGNTPMADSATLVPPDESIEYTIHYASVPVDNEHTNDPETDPDAFVEVPVSGIYLETTSLSTTDYLSTIGTPVLLNGSTVYSTPGSSLYQLSVAAEGELYSKQNLQYRIGLKSGTGLQQVTAYPFVPYAILAHRYYNEVKVKVEVETYVRMADWGSTDYDTDANTTYYTWTSMQGPYTLKEAENAINFQLERSAGDIATDRAGYASFGAYNIVRFKVRIWNSTGTFVLDEFDSGNDIGRLGVNGVLHETWRSETNIDAPKKANGDDYPDFYETRVLDELYQYQRISKTRYNVTRIHRRMDWDPQPDFNSSKGMFSMSAAVYCNEWVGSDCNNQKNVVLKIQNLRLEQPFPYSRLTNRFVPFYGYVSAGLSGSKSTYAFFNEVKPEPSGVTFSKDFAEEFTDPRRLAFPGSDFFTGMITKENYAAYVSDTDPEKDTAVQQIFDDSVQRDSQYDYICDWNEAQKNTEGPDSYLASENFEIIALTKPWQGGMDVGGIKYDDDFVTNKGTSVRVWTDYSTAPDYTFITTPWPAPANYAEDWNRDTLAEKFVNSEDTVADEITEVNFNYTGADSKVKYLLNATELDYGEKQATATIVSGESQYYGDAMHSYTSPLGVVQTLWSGDEPAHLLKDAARFYVEDLNSADKTFFGLVSENNLTDADAGKECSYAENLRISAFTEDWVTDWTSADDPYLANTSGLLKSEYKAFNEDTFSIDARDPFQAFVDLYSGGSAKAYPSASDTTIQKQLFLNLSSGSELVTGYRSPVTGTEGKKHNPNVVCPLD